MHDESADEHAKDTKRNHARLATEPGTLEYGQRGGPQKFAFAAPFRRISWKVSFSVT